jgi:Apea-like HEPN
VHPQAKSQLISELLSVSKLAEDRIPDVASDIGGNLGHGPFALAGSARDAFETLRDRLLRGEHFEETVTDNFLTQALLDAVSETHFQPDEHTATQVFEDFLKQINDAVREHTVYVPLDGLSMGREPVALGNVTLFTMTRAKIDEILNKATTVFAALIENVVDRVSAEFVCIAEKARAIERAKEESTLAIDVLRFAVPFMADFNYSRDHLTFGIQGSVPSLLTCTIFVRARDTRLASSNVGITGPIPFTLNDSTLERLRLIGALRISDILRKPLERQSDFEKVLLRGVHWFANAQIQTERESELLNLITCLETFLTPKDNNPIGTAIAEGTALLLEATLPDRKRMKRRVQQLYRLRSAVSHGGEKAIADSDIGDLREIAKRIMSKMIDLADRTESQKALFDIIEDAKLT